VEEPEPFEESDDVDFGEVELPAESLDLLELLVLPELLEELFFLPASRESVR
jgi:hypothetical protein